jgi:hypothetical protein
VTIAKSGMVFSGKYSWIVKSSVSHVRIICIDEWKLFIWEVEGNVLDVSCVQVIMMKYCVSSVHGISGVEIVTVVECVNLSD